MELSKTPSLQGNIFTDPTSLDDPFLHLPLQSNIQPDKEILAISSEGLIECPFITSMKFFEEYKKIYSVSYQLHIQKIKLVEKIQKIERRISAIEPNQDSNKKYKCQAEECHRLYTTKESLQQHMKLKHPHHMSSTIDQAEQEYGIDSC